MAWFTRRKDPPPAPHPDPRAGRLGPEPALPRTAETPGLVLSSAAEAATLGALFGISGPAAEISVAAAREGAGAARPVPGISGLRIIFRDAETVVLRLGPPPGARWALRGVERLAVLGGRLTAVDGEEARELRAGVLAVAACPAATLYLEAGNDAALALAIAGPSFVATLG